MLDKHSTLCGIGSVAWPICLADFLIMINHPIQGCPMVALKQISHSAELRICPEALAPKMGLEQIRSKYLLPVSNPLICQNDMEEPPKCTILRLQFQNFWGWPPEPPPTPQNGMEAAPKYTILRSKFQHFLGLPPDPPPNPLKLYGSAPKMLYFTV